MFLKYGILIVSFMKADTLNPGSQNGNGITLVTNVQLPKK